MVKTPSPSRGSNSAAVTNYLNNLKVFFVTQFHLGDAAALEKAKEVVAMEGAPSFFDDRVENGAQSSEGNACSGTDEPHSVYPHLMVDHMEAGFRSAFEDAFGTERAKSSYFVGYMMEILETGGHIEELMENLPATSEDASRLGVLPHGNSSYEFLPRNTVEFICESLLNDAEDDESKGRALRKIETLRELFTRVRHLVGRSGPSDETIVNLHWALRQLVVLTQVGLPREPVDYEVPPEAAGKVLLKSLGQLPRD